MRDYKKDAQDLRRIAKFQNCFECFEGERTEGSCSSRCTLSKAADAIEELLDELTTIRKQLPHWISVGDELPEDGEFVLVCNDDGHMMIAKHESEVYEWYYKYTNYDFDIWDNEEQGPVLWWMPLPAPPKEET